MALSTAVLLKIKQLLCCLKPHWTVKKERTESGREENSYDGDFLWNGEISFFSHRLLIIVKHIVYYVDNSNRNIVS